MLPVQPKLLAANIPTKDKTYTWTVNVAHPGAAFRLMLSDNRGTSAMSQPFTIVAGTCAMSVYVVASADHVLQTVSTIARATVTASRAHACATLRASLFFCRCYWLVISSSCAFFQPGYSGTACELGETARVFCVCAAVRQLESVPHHCTAVASRIGFTEPKENAHYHVGEAVQVKWWTAGEVGPALALHLYKHGAAVLSLLHRLARWRRAIV